MRSRLSVLVGLALIALVALPMQAAAKKPPKPPKHAGSYIVVLNDSADPDAVAKKQEGKGVKVKDVYKSALKAYSGDFTADQIAAVEDDPSVDFVSEDAEVNLEAQSVPTGIARINGPSSSTASGNGSGSVNVNVAVIDTGISLSHPDLNVVGGKDCITTKKKKMSYADDNGHGSHVAGTIAARDDANGVVGVAPGARLWAVKVLNSSGSGSFSNVICGIDFVTSTRTDSDPTNDIAVANMSLGGGGSDDGNCGNTNGDALHRAICNSVAKGVTYVVAAGNSAVDFKNSVPAAYDEVLTVSALADFNGAPGGGGAPTCRSDVDDTYGDFSSYAVLPADQNHTIAAPGVCILSTWLGSGYNTISGTSMASPHVAGVAALCIATGKCTGTPANKIAKLRSDAAAYNTANPGYGFSGDPLHPVSGKYFGYLIRAAAY